MGLKSFARIAVTGVLALTSLTLWHLSHLDNHGRHKVRVEIPLEIPVEVSVEPPVETPPSLPPLYADHRTAEREFPQHNPVLPIPDGGYATFLWIPNHQAFSGWGNSLQEIFLNAHLARSAKRSFVFDDYTWDKDTEEPYSDYNGKLIPSRIPLSAMISGPIIGQSRPEADVPRAVSKEYFEKVCPNRTLISNDEVTAGVNGADALGIFEAWLEKLKTVHDRCVEVDRKSSQIFSFWVFGSSQILELWPTLSVSPVVTELGWSPLILSAVEENKSLFYSSNATATFNAQAPIEGLLAVHVRRGDFADQCTGLAKWASTYNGFNTFPEFPDKFTPLPNSGDGVSTPENMALYMKHCLPTLEEIVQRVSDVRASTYGANLKKLYIMTNGHVEWARELKVALAQAGDWEGIGCSRDLSLSWEQKYVSHSVDMAIGQKAEVFIGNGWSSLTSNVAMLRVANNFPPESTRFW